jgi:YD repeat-containing protein
LTGVTAGRSANTLTSYTLTYATNGTGAPATNRLNTIVEGSSYSVGYDNAGNLSSDGSPSGGTYQYDGAARLKTATTANSSYEYDGDGWRVKQVANGGSTC